MSGSPPGTRPWLRAAALGLAVGCSLPSQDPSPHRDFDALSAAVASPEALGWSREGLTALEGHAKTLGAAAVLIVTDGQLVFSLGDPQRPFRAHSIRKSFLSALYGIAIAEGQIDPSDTLAALGIDDKTPLTPAEKKATVLDLLSARSGIYLRAASETRSMRQSRPERHRHPPGTHWHYNNWDFNALGTIYRKATGNDVFEAFQRLIARPIGMQDFDLSATRYQLEDASIHPSYKFRISARDLARFGLLYLDEGFWQGRRILPAGWVDRSTRALSVTGRKGSKAGFGLMWWVSGTPEAPAARAAVPPPYSASGTGGHRLTVLPSIDTVVVFRTDTDDPEAGRVGSTAYDGFLAVLSAARLPAPDQLP